MPGRRMIAQCVAILLASACAPSTRNAGLLPTGAEVYLNSSTGAESYLDSNGHLRSIRNGWTGHQPVRGDEVLWEENEGQQNLAHARSTTPFPVSTSAPIGPAASDTRPTTATLAPQERCAMQAKRTFEELHANAQVGQTLLDEYKSHYYTITGKCLMLVERNYVDTVAPAREDFHVLASLIDANDRRQYAAYEQTGPLNELPSVPGAAKQPPRCELSPGVGEERKCTTRAEFDAFVARYLEE